MLGNKLMILKDEVKRGKIRHHQKALLKLFKKYNFTKSEFSNDYGVMRFTKKD